MNEIEKAIQEFEDNAYHPSLKPDISDSAKAIALSAMKAQQHRQNKLYPVSMEVFRQLLFDLAMDMTDGGAKDHPNEKWSERLIELSNKPIRESEVEQECQVYRDAAKTYGIDARTMLSLAKSQIKTSADNIRIMERVRELAKEIPSTLTPYELERALCEYDGDGSKAFCDLVYAGLKIIQKIQSWERENNEWWICSE